MKKYLLLVSLGLGLLGTSASSNVCPHEAEGRLLRNAVPWQIFVFDNNKKLICSLPARAAGPFSIPPLIYVSKYPVYSEVDGHKIERSTLDGCFDLWNNSSTYYTANKPCGIVK